MAKKKRFFDLKKIWKTYRPVAQRLAVFGALMLVTAPPTLVAITAFSPTTIMGLQWILRGPDVSQYWRDMDRISPHLRHAVMAGEDSKFCAHDGFDWDAIEAAWAHNQSGGKKRGASTISMQTAKNVFLWQNRSWTRKGFEAYFTVLIELMWSKPKILEAYLNVVEWGDGVYGAEAAARHHFGKSAARLSRIEAARLAAILPSPVKWQANPPGRYVQQRANLLQKRMRVVENGHANCLKPTT